MRRRFQDQIRTNVVPSRGSVRAGVRSADWPQGEDEAEVWGEEGEREGSKWRMGGRGEEKEERNGDWRRYE